MTYFRAFDLPVALIISLSCLLGEVFVWFITYLSKGMILPYQVHWIFKQLESYPLQGGMFGLCFSLGIAFSLRERLNITFAEVTGMIFLCMVLQLGLPMIFSLLMPVLRELHFEVYINSTNHFLNAFLIAQLTKLGLKIEIGLTEMLLTGVLGVLISNCYFNIPQLALSMNSFWYFFVGSFLGLFASRMACHDYGLRLR